MSHRIFTDSNQMLQELPGPTETGGIILQGLSITETGNALQDLLGYAVNLGLEHLIKYQFEDDRKRVRLNFNRQLAPRSDIDKFDTLQVCKLFHLDTQSSTSDLEKEILLCLLVGPLPFEFPCFNALKSSIQVRANIVRAARKTALAFHTSKIERPTDCWQYSEEHGFILKSASSLLDGLRKATQPGVSGERYAFSCYRATEYVILLGIAEEAKISNPELLRELQQQWEIEAIQSRKFHDTFLHEFGSLENPLPAKYYIPGDRLWFRNPDARSADIEGFEGSWVIYLGNGLFSNFWEEDKPFTLTAKCIEIYHWRDGVKVNPDGTLMMDEAAVAEQVALTLHDSEKCSQILDRMLRLRDPQGVYAEGGCIDASRECPRIVCAENSEIRLTPNCK